MLYTNDNVELTADHVHVGQQIHASPRTGVLTIFEEFLKVRSTSRVLWMAVVSQSSVKSQVDGIARASMWKQAHS